jgi:hypothetical protein
MQIRSELRLPELAVGSGTAQVVFELGPAYPAVEASYDRSGWVRADRRRALLFVEDVGVIRLEDGRRVRITPVPGVRESLLRMYLTGPVMAVLAYQRGMLALHGCVLQIDGKAIAILSESGGGKSSLAAVLHARGHAFLADDLAAVDWPSGRAMLFPGYPQIKLSPEIAEFIGIPFSRLPELDPEEPKRAWKTGGLFSTAPVPLNRVFILSEGDVRTGDALRTQQAVVELIRHSYPARLLHAPDGAHLRQCTRLAGEIPLGCLKRAEDLSGLSRQADWIEACLDRDYESAEGLPSRGKDTKQRWKISPGY